MRIVASLFLLAGTAVLTAQEPASTRNFEQLQQAFERQRAALVEKGSTRAERQELTRKQLAELQSFIDREARGDDVWLARLLQADLQTGLGERAAASAALSAIDRKQAPLPLLLEAAVSAQGLGQNELRGQFIDAAVGRKAPLHDRLHVATVLMTALREVARGEQLFATALAAATDDEAKSEVRWLHCSAVREREDLPENAYYEALEKLSQELPKTYWGGVARDRLAASRFRVGEPALAFTAKALDGTAIEQKSGPGDPTLLVFWSATGHSAKNTAAAVAELRKQHAGLRVIGIAMERDLAAFAAACKTLGADFPQIGDGRGFDTDLALRHHVETEPTIIAIDRQGRIAGLNLQGDNKDGLAELRQVVGTICGK